MKKFPDPIFTPVAENIKENREDERKALLNAFSARLDSIACKVTIEKMNYADVHQLLVSESLKLANDAAELNYV